MTAGTHLAFPKFICPKMTFSVVMQISQLLLGWLDSILFCEYSAIANIINIIFTSNKMLVDLFLV